jgi:hypothetical protein
MQQFLKFITYIYVQLNVFRASSRPSSGAQVALLPPRSNGKTKGCYCSWAPDDGREDARNMLSCT